MLLNRRYGAVGLVAMPYFALFEFLSPVFSLGGILITIVLWLLGVLSATYFLRSCSSRSASECF
jgi:hypothetical protein